MTKRRLGLHLTGRTASELAAAAQECEAAGIESLWASELYTNPFVPIAAVAGATKHIQVGSGVALAFIRSPFALALSALDLDALTEGRFTLGLGTGVKALNEQWHGVSDWGPPVRHMREVVAFIREFERSAHEGKPIRMEGEFVNVNIKGYKRPWPPVRERLPIHLGASKPGMLALAGEVADGIIGHLFWSPEQFRGQAVPAIKKGLDRAGRDRRELTVSVGVTCAIDDDEKRARKFAAGPLAFYATVKTYQPIFEGDGFGEEVAAIRKAFLSGDKKGAVSKVTDEMIDCYCAVGSMDRVRKHLSKWGDEIDVLGATPPRHFCPDEVIAEYRTKILELAAT